MKVGVVLVTYNRIDKLKIALKAYDDQILKPKYILVVNNHSTDDTENYLKEWQKEEKEYKKIVLNLDSNTGGSGGFHAGLQKSLELDADWVWVADDDAYPKKDTFQKAKEYLDNIDKKDEIVSLCGKVLRQDGKIDFSHRRNIYSKFGFFIVQPYSKQKDYEKKEFEINTFSYVGSMINKEKMKQIPLTKKDNFIYFDDTDHSYRLSKLGKIICLTNMEVVHDAPHENMNQIVKWKLYYLVRNTLEFIKDNFDERNFKFSCFFVKLEFDVAVLLFGKNKKYGYKMIKEGVKDAKEGVTGLHKIYKPGWKP